VYSPPTPRRMPLRAIDSSKTVPLIAPLAQEGIRK